MVFCSAEKAARVAGFYTLGLSQGEFQVLGGFFLSRRSSLCLSLSSAPVAVTAAFILADLARSFARACCAAHVSVLLCCPVAGGEVGEFLVLGD